MALRKFESVLYHVNQHLLEASAVTDKPIWQRIFDLLQLQARTLDLRLLGEHVQHEVEGVAGRKSFPSHSKFTLVELDEVQHVGHLAEEQVDLGDDQEYFLAHVLLKEQRQNAFKDH